MLKAMKTVKLYISLALLLVVVCCKKKEAVAPDVLEMDLTKYFITWESPTAFSGGRTYNLPALIFFDGGGQATIHWFSTIPPQTTSYKFEDDKIIVTINDKSRVFNLEDENITSISGVDFPMENVKLHKVPETNQFIGKYSGMLTSRLVNTAFPFKYVFAQTQFGEEVVADPTLDYAINPIKNVFATSFIDNIRRHFLIIDGKLSIVRIHVGGTNASTFLCATLAREE